MKEIVIDIETQNTFQDVGGKQNLDKLRISVIGLYEYEGNTFRAFVESEIPQALQIIREAERIIGYNIKGFDLPIISAYGQLQIDRVSITDLFEDITRVLGYRVGLDSFARATLGVEKSGSGMQAIRWYSEGNIEAIKKYCLDDVRITRDLYEYGKRRGEVRFISRETGEVYSVPVAWGFQRQDPQLVAQVLSTAFKNHLCVNIQYLIKNGGEQQAPQAEQKKVEIRDLHGEMLTGYCRIEDQIIQCKKDWILTANITLERYPLKS